jgi:hypothetical protein
MSSSMRSIRRRTDERGFVLVVALIMTLVLGALGAALSVGTRGSVQVGTSLKNHQSAFEIAVAGLERAREDLRLARYDTIAADYSAILAARVGADGVLVAPTARGNFEVGGSMTTGFTNSTDDVPLVTATNLLASASASDVAGRYQVFLANGGADAVDSTVDSDNTITLTSIASAANERGHAIVQGVFRTPVPNLPNLPALIYLPGPDVEIGLPNSNPAVFDGDSTPPGGPPHCLNPIAGSTNTAVDAIRDEAPKPNNYHGCNTTTGAGATNVNTTVENVCCANADGTPAGNPYNDPAGTAAPSYGPLADIRLMQVSYLNQLVADLTAVAHYTSTSDAGFSTGTIANPKIVVLNGNYSLGPGQHAGILVVKGELTTNGNTSFNGLIYVIGQGRLTRNGNGNGTLCGGMLVADVVNNGEAGDSWIASNLVGIPYVQLNGGGNSGTIASTTCNVGGPNFRSLFSVPLMRLSFQNLIG